MHIYTAAFSFLFAAAIWCSHAVPVEPATTEEANTTEPLTLYQVFLHIQLGWFGELNDTATTAPPPPITATTDMKVTTPSSFSAEFTTEGPVKHDWTEVVTHDPLTGQNTTDAEVANKLGTDQLAIATGDPTGETDDVVYEFFRWE